MPFTSGHDVKDARQVLGAQLVPSPTQESAIVTVSERCVLCHAAPSTAYTLERVHTPRSYRGVVKGPVEPGSRRVSLYLAGDGHLFHTSGSVHSLLTGQAFRLDCNEP